MTAHGKHSVRSDAAMAAAILLLGGFLWISGLPFADRWILSGAGRRALDFDQLLGTAATAAGLAIAAWWVLSMLSAFTAAVLERTGRKRAAATAGKLCPAFMRRLALAVLSVQLVSAPLAHAETPSGPVWLPTQGAAAPAAWEPTGGSAAMAFVAAASSAPEEQGSASELQPDWRPTAPVPDPGLTVARPLRAGQAPPSSRTEVTVLAGDTLWDIAARELGPAASDVEVALHWPRWYQANKAEIGENPDVLLPGQILKPPAAA